MNTPPYTWCISMLQRTQSHSDWDASLVFDGWRHCNLSPRRATSTRLNPWPANSLAKARPMPAEAPVISAVLLSVVSMSCAGIPDSFSIYSLSPCWCIVSDRSWVTLPCYYFDANILSFKIHIFTPEATKAVSHISCLIFRLDTRSCFRHTRFNRRLETFHSHLHATGMIW